MNVLITSGTFMNPIVSMIRYIKPDANIEFNFSKNCYYDLVIFSGGADINPKIYGEKNVASYYNEDRDEKEIEIIDNVFGKTKIFGICRGLQLISAYAYGLKLIQDIKPPHKSIHEVAVNKYGIKTVNSIHHQGVHLNQNFPNNYKLLAIHEDIVEAFIDRKNKVLGVQFHPEIIYKEDYMKDFVRNLGKFILE